MAAWLEHAACQLQAVEHVFFCSAWGLFCYNTRNNIHLIFLPQKTHKKLLRFPCSTCILPCNCHHTCKTLLSSLHCAPKMGSELNMNVAGVDDLPCFGRLSCIKIQSEQLVGIHASCPEKFELPFRLACTGFMNTSGVLIALPSSDGPIGQNPQQKELRTQDENVKLEETEVGWQQRLDGNNFLFSNSNPNCLALSSNSSAQFRFSQVHFNRHLIIGCKKGNNCVGKYSGKDNRATLVLQNYKYLQPRTNQGGFDGPSFYVIASSDAFIMNHGWNEYVRKVWLGTDNLSRLPQKYGHVGDPNWGNIFSLRTLYIPHYSQPPQLTSLPPAITCRLLPLLPPPLVACLLLPPCLHTVTSPPTPLLAHSQPWPQPSPRSSQLRILRPPHAASSLPAAVERKTVSVGN
ncbi:hypothetical protein VP01_5532g1 [Puccinia sorghi]|uniref:Uncharacterized protein n=1 Tax=Puccinia sorghi TaxID=27349 RepID=A0A0L6UJC2_9BASI|nr:hypothetical protein VP01_5532g1 [Puccinia sorghi]